MLKECPFCRTWIEDDERCCEECREQIAAVADSVELTPEEVCRANLAIFASDPGSY